MNKTATSQYPIHPLLAGRWSPRAFDARPVEPAELRSLLEAARWAASSFNEQPWRFIVARREDSVEFAKLLACLVEANRVWARDAGALVLTVAKRRFTRNDQVNRVAEHDIGLAVANLTLQAEELGLRVHQMAGVDLAQAREAYAIPDGYDPLTAVAIGHAGDPGRLPEALREAEQEPRERRPQREFVFGSTWGRPATW
jgi:nitroreductase